MGANHLENPKSVTFFNDLLSNDIHILMTNNNRGYENIKLEVSINQINPNCRYNIKLYNKINYEKYPLNKVDQCSISDNLTAKLDSPILIPYYFGQIQHLLIEILKTKNGKIKKYEINTTLGCIMGNINNNFQNKISPSKKEIIIIQGKKVEQSEHIMNIKFEAKANNHCINFKDEKNKIYYEVYSEPNLLLYRSECFNEQGKFNPVKIPLYLFQNKNIKILFFKNTKTIAGVYNLTIYEFQQEKEFNVAPFQVLSRSKITKNYTFIDYLKAGIQIRLSVAIDFTRSNGNPNDAKSLHFIDRNNPNQYERAIKACGYLLGFYDYNQIFPCFGFGAKINHTHLQIFNLNFQRNPNIKFIDGIIEEYHKAIKKVQLGGPSNFAPIIRKMNNIIKEQKNKLKYHILMIITDGTIDDLNETIDELVEGSFLTLSIIIIGVGDADFSNMVYLDADKNPLVNSKGVKSVRDLVQFVPFLKYESNPKNLAIEVLKEIPWQIVEYYEQNNLDPTNLRP